MAARFSPQDVIETEVKRRHGAHVQRRGDGFTEAESMGMLQLARSRWREGWDVIAQLHNAQFAKHNRSADSLKKKFSRLYRSNIPPRGAKNHQAITFAHVVHKEMIEGVPPAPGTAVSSVDGETPVESSEASFQQGDERTQDGAAEMEHNWVDTATEVPAAATSSPAAVSVPTAAVATQAPGASAPRPHARVPRQLTEWQSPAIFPPDATPLPTDDLLTSVLKVILRSQYQRDLDREEERQRRDEERQRRREEAEQRRQEEDRRRDEQRDEQRRRNEERTEERAENRRRHEQYMQMMTLLVGKNSAPQPRDTEC
ncbi:hypothetical protein PI125_g155 [Phytophthora idaei]|nr:hypothetical protein PI125_g155 [Phytophthora idaei]KAG3175093.1 hypothetical protein PI126_g38 [Phytophthora idaei]